MSANEWMNVYFPLVFADPCRGHWTSWRSTRSSTTTTFSSRRRWTNTSCSRKNKSCATSCMKPKWQKKLSWVRHVIDRSNAYMYPLVLCVNLYHTVASGAGLWYISNLSNTFLVLKFINWTCSLSSAVRMLICSAKYWYYDLSLFHFCRREPSDVPTGSAAAEPPLPLWPPCALPPWWSVRTRPSRPSQS